MNTHRKIYVVMILACLTMSGCITLYEVRKPDIYQNNLKGMPKEDDISFRSSQQLKSTATEAYKKSEQIYYEGVEARNKLAEFVRDANFRIMTWLGPVISNMQLETPEQLQEYLKKTDKALEEYQQLKYNYEKDVKEWKHKLATKDDIIKSEKSKLKGYKATLFKGLTGFVILIFVILLALGVIQAWTGIPVLSMFLGGVRHIFGGLKQLVHSIQDFKEDLREQIEKEEDPKIKEGLLKSLEKLKHHCNDKQDERTKKCIKKIKEKIKKV